MDAESAALVQRMEALMNEVAKMKNIIAQRDKDIARLTSESESRKQAMSLSDESDMVRRLRHEIKQRQDDLERMRSAVAEKEHENEQYLENIERQRQQQALSGPDDMHEVVQIRERRQQNDDLQAEVRQLMAKLSLLTVQQRDVEKSLRDKEHQAQEAKRRAEQNHNTERDLAEQLQDLGQLKERHQRREEELKELAQAVEAMDMSFQQVDVIVDALDAERAVAGNADRSGTIDFERSPLIGMWLGSAAAALATMTVARISNHYNQSWVTPFQQEQAQLDISKRVAEIGAVKKRLAERLLHMKQRTDAARGRLEDAKRQREDARADRDKLQHTLDAEVALLVGNLQAQLPVLEQHKIEAENAEADAKSEWERVEANAKAKYAEAEALLDKQLQLIEREQEETRAIFDRNRAQQEEEKALLLARLQQQHVPTGYTSPA